MKRILALLILTAMVLTPVASWGAVPQSVMDAYYADGGKISYVTALYLDGQKCWGVYYWKDKSIRISRDAPETTVAHEIGHWMYHRQVWSGELQDHANQAFAATPLRELSDENFAIGYAMYCCGGLGGDLADFYKEIEQQI